MANPKSSNYRYELMTGRIHAEKKSSSNIVRVFVSSTFSDMADERNVLYTHAYPELRNFCQYRGLEFQAIDMRWGVRDTASVDHSTSALCLLEVRNCKRISLGPYFVVFFGNRYGYQPLPNSIPDTVFAPLHQVASDLRIDQGGLLDKWYKLDTNCIPHARILEPITRHFPHFDDVTPEFAKEREVAKQEWDATFKALSEVIKNSATNAAARGLIPRDAEMGFCKSITQMEIEEGMQNHGNGFLAYNREISDLQKYTTESKARVFIDMVDGEEAIDKERQRLLKSLKKNVKRHTGKGMFKKYDITWKQLENVYLDAQDETKDNYLEIISDDFVDDIKRCIMKCIHDRENIGKASLSDDPLLEEVSHHADFELLKTTDFCGREQLIGEVSDLINDSHNRHPIVLVGSSGSGKTSLMAKLVETERNRSSESYLVYRFLGTSPDSSNIHKLLTSLILQISTIYGEDLPPSFKLQNFADVVELFAKLLKKVSTILENKTECTLTIFLDSIDQLSIEDGAHRMTWLPKTIFRNVRIVLSSLPEPDFVIVPTMRRYITESNIKTVHGLNVETAREILQKSLGNVNRCLTETQTNIILTAFEKSPYPLFLKLMLEEAKRWRSHDDTDDLVLAETSRAAISNFYDRLERDHGRMFVSRSIGYLVAARDGVTENELQDLLSLDDDVLYDVYEYWSPPSDDVVRIPPFTWTRLNYDLGEYIVQRQATGHTVLALYHRQFIEVAKQRYLQQQDSEKVYKVMSEYFSGTYGKGIKKKLILKMWNEPRDVDRRVANQPLQFSNSVFNVRKMRELPYCLLQAALWNNVRSDVLANARWLKTKIKAFSIKEVIEDFDLALKQHPDTEIRLIRDAIKLAKPTLEFPAGVRNHLFAELYCRLKFFSEEFPEYIKKLVDECHRFLKENEDEILLPYNGYFQPPGGPLRTTITGFQTPVTHVKFSTVENIFAAGSSGGALMIWDTMNDEVVHRIDAHSEDITFIDFTGHEARNKIATCSKDKFVKMFHLDNGNMCFTADAPQLGTTNFVNLHLLTEVIVCVTDHMLQSWNFDTKESKICVKLESDIMTSLCINTNDRQIIIVGLENGKCVGFDSKTGQEVGSTNSEETSSPILTLVDLQPDNECTIFVRKNGTLSLLNKHTFEIQNSTSNVYSDVTGFAKSTEGKLVAVFGSNAVQVYSIKDGKITLKHDLKEHHDMLKNVKFMDAQTLAVAYVTKKVLIWKLEDGKKSRVINTWEGTGASIDHLEIGKHVGVTASYQMFYLKVWDLTTEDVVPPHPALQLENSTSTLSSDGSCVTYVREGKLVVQSVTDVTNPKTNNKFQTLPELDAHLIKSVNFVDQGRNLIILKKDGRIIKTSTNSFLQEQKGKDISDNLSGNSDTQSIQFFEEGIDVCGVWIQDDEKIITATIKNSNEDLTSNILVLKTEDLSELKRIPLNSNVGYVTAVFSTDNFILVGTATGVIYLYQKNDKNSHQYRESGVFSEHNSSITCLVVNKTKTMMFTGSKGRVRRIWSLKNGIPTVKHELRFESLLESGVTCAQFSHGDKCIFAGSRERSITIWDTDTGELLGAHYVYAPVLDLVVTTDRRLIFTSELGYVAVAKFRPPGENRRSFVKSNKSQLTNKSSTCNLM